MENAPFFGQTVARCDMGWAVISLERYASGELGEHRHAGVCSFVLLSGEHQDATDWTRIDQSPATAILRPEGLRHSTLVGPRGMVGINVAWRDAAAAPDCQDYRLFSDHAVRRAAIRLAVALRQQGDVEGSTWDLVAAMAGPALTTPVWFGEVLDTIGASGVTPPSLSALAHRVGVHPVTLCKAFRQATGATYSEYVAGIRAASVCSGILSGQGVGESCVEAGFADHAHGTRTFRRMVGAPPTALLTH